MATAHELLILIRLQDQATRGLKSLTRDLSTLDGAANGIQTAVTRVGVAAIGAAAGVATLGINFNRMRETSEVAFGALIGDAGKATQILDQLQAMSLVSPVAISNLFDYAQRMIALGVATDKVVPTLRTIAAATAALGEGSDRFNRIALAISQITAKGRLQAEELRQLAEAGVPALQLLATNMGKTTTAVLKQVKTGFFDAKTALDILIPAMEQRFSRALEAASKTFNGMFRIALNAAQIWSGIASGPIFDRIRAQLMRLVGLMQSGEWQASARRVAQALEQAFDTAARYLLPTLQRLFEYIKSSGPTILDALRTAWEDANNAVKVAYALYVGFEPVLRAVVNLFVESVKWLNDHRAAVYAVVAAYAALQVSASVATAVNTLRVAIINANVALLVMKGLLYVEITAVLALVGAAIITFSGKWDEVFHALPIPVLESLIKITEGYEDFVRVTNEFVNKIIGTINAIPGAPNISKLPTGEGRLSSHLKDILNENRLGAYVAEQERARRAVIAARDAHDDLKKSVDSVIPPLVAAGGELEDDGKAARKYAEYLERLGKALEDIQQKLRDLTISGIDELGDLLEEALRRQAEASRDSALAVVEAQRIAYDAYHEGRLDQIERERTAAIKAIQDQIDALDVADFRDDLGELQRQLKIAYDPREAYQLQRDIDALLRDQQREKLRDEIKRLEEVFDAQQDFAEREAKLAEENFKRIEKAAEDAYKAQTKEAELQRKVRELLLSGEMETMKTLIESYIDDWASTGLSYGEQMVNGIKASGLAAYIEGIISRANLLRGIMPGGVATGVGGGGSNPAWQSWINQAASLKAGGAPEAAVAQLRRDFEKAFPGTAAPFAYGGLITKPTLALMGERASSRPEIVSPEALMRRIVREEGGGGMGDVHVYIGDTELKGLIRVEYDQQQRQSRRGAMLHGTRI